jgi:hypothetical protein
VGDLLMQPTRFHRRDECYLIAFEEICQIHLDFIVLDIVVEIGLELYVKIRTVIESLKMIKFEFVDIG